MKKLIVICGPTATGKTALGIKLAKKFNGEIVSADSRQVYIGMDIGTGKDIPKASKLNTGLFKSYGFYEIDGVKVWGYDLVKPNREFSVAQYIKKARRIIKDIWGKGKLPIIVGGTGLYIKAIVDGIETTVVPKNKNLRKLINSEPISELYERLAQLDSLKAATMNISDRNNPRRLIRAIEIAEWQIRKGRRVFKSTLSTKDVLLIGIFGKQDSLCAKIKKRIEKRLKDGFEEEVKGLLEKVPKNSQATTSLGYKEWRQYLEGKLSRQEAIEKWNREECNYAKRQMTWFKKDRRIIWFDIDEKAFEKKIEKTTQRWYSSVDA